MATHRYTPMLEQRQRGVDDYKNCLIKPMGRGDEPLIDARHILDAVLVSGVVFFTVVLGDVAFSFTSGEFVWLSMRDIANRAPTAVMAFFLTFFAQWARARGLDIRQWLIDVLDR